MVARCRRGFQYFATLPTLPPPRRPPAADRASQNRPDRFQSGPAPAHGRQETQPTDMAHPPPLSAPAVRLEIRHGAARPVTYDVTGDEFVIGTVSGCDLRLTGANLPPVLCAVARHAEGPRL